MKITIAHSPNSDDAFMFYGLAKGKLDTGGLEVGDVLTDIETLNQEAKAGRYETTWALLIKRKGCNLTLIENLLNTND